ncbi:formate dehydrogenase subunit gamma [Chelatococcus sp. SYSU_G07232]|uniref:Formate dehydrogenase subunit gamma n=1 Tax=Chelatococcus albus TaxID=3047466 RepID=A0ABT7AJR5_9HYPH|nr:formate dehydrogenase subunit gamma [Chelatococcus sp. SYSU_G07232]MDJ1159621.1 formate dehydrogenase subunit gamma [Chelatococcus sp. SYSU_G07232]
MTRGGFGRRIAVAAFVALFSVCLAMTLAPRAGWAQQARQGVNPTAQAVKEEQLLKELDRVTGRVSIPDSKAGTLIQPEGREWRAYHERTLHWIGGIAILGMLAVLALFYSVRGKIRIEHGWAGVKIMRFTTFERFVHWLTASSFIVLALSGLNVVFGKVLLLPLVGSDAFAVFSQWAKYAHNYLSFAFAAGIVLTFVIWVTENIPNRTDIAWAKQGGGILGHAHPPAGKFNGGQKLIFWSVVLVGAAIAASGYVLMFPFYGTNIADMQVAQIIHGVLGVLMIAVILAHIYIGTLGMEGAFDAMGTGEVDLNWAKEHHSLWVEEEMSKARAAGGGAAVPAE